MNGSVHPAMLIRDGDRVRAATAREEEMGERRAAERASSSEPEYARDRLAQRAANYEVDEEHDIQTQDYEDHTFSGIMFTLQVLDRAVEQVVLRGVAVRGELGPMTVWAAKGRWHDFEGLREDRRAWTLLHAAGAAPSYRRPKMLELCTPLALEPGEVVSIYVHSGLHSDTGIVYDNQHRTSGCEDGYLRVGAACAHLSPTPFSGYHPWGAWRDRRAFVGRLSYGVKHLLWQPEKRVHAAFPTPFRRMVTTLLVLHRRNDNYVADLPEDILYYILHMCGTTWAGDAEPEPAPGSVAAVARRTSSTVGGVARAVKRALARLLGYGS